MDDSGNAIVSVDGDGGSDTLLNIQNIRGSTFTDTIIGDANVNIIEGGDSTDTLDGDGGDDTLDGGAGNDTLLSGLGNDTFIGGADFDTIDFSPDGVATSVRVILRGSSDGEVFVNGSGTREDTLQSIENIIATSGADDLTGDSNQNTIFGGLGDDIIRAGAGNDSFDGGTGNTDTLRFDNLIQSGVNLDLVNNSAVYTFDSSTDNFSNFEEYYTTNLADLSAARAQMKFPMAHHPHPQLRLKSSLMAQTRQQ